MREAQYDKPKPKKFVSVELIQQKKTEVAKLKRFVEKAEKRRAASRKRKSSKPAAKPRGRPKLPPAALTQRLGPAEMVLHQFLFEGPRPRADICAKFAWTDNTARAAIARLGAKMAEWKPPAVVVKTDSPDGMIYHIV